MRTRFEGFHVWFKSFDAATRVVRVGSPVGGFSAVWMDDRDPKPGDSSGVEFTTEPTIWGVGVVDAFPDEPDAILEDTDGWIFVGKILGVERGWNAYADGGRFIPEHDLRDGIFYLRIGESVLMFDADGLPADAAGRRVRVRQTVVVLYPE